jgi:hypothetical protein
MSGALPVTLATDGPGVAALTQMSRWAPGLKSDGTAAAAAQAAASITADPAASATKVGSIVGGQTATLSCTMSAQAQDGTYWCNYIVVPSGAAAPTAGDGTIWAGQTVYIVAPGTAAYDVYAIRGAAGKIGMFCQLSLGQAAA